MMAYNPIQIVKGYEFFMEQKRIPYCVIQELGFEEQRENDDAYFKMYGFHYVIITLNLNEKLFIDWAKETGFCELIRVDNHEDGNVKGRMEIKDESELKRIINFYKDDNISTN